jgi:hypothetical protein
LITPLTYSVSSICDLAWAALATAPAPVATTLALVYVVPKIEELPVTPADTAKGAAIAPTATPIRIGSTTGLVWGATLAVTMRATISPITIFILILLKN